MYRRVLGIAAALVALAGVHGVAAQTGISMANLTALNGSGESGTVTLTSIDANSTKVEIRLSNAPAEAQPAHIHPGSCANLNPTPKYPLTNVVNGSSVTTVNVPITDLLGGKYAVNVHKSATDLGTYVACGDLTALSSSGGTNTGGGTTGGTTTPPTTVPTTGAPQAPTWPFALGSGLLLLVAGGALRKRRA